MKSWYGLADILARSAADTAVRGRTAVTFGGRDTDYTTLMDRVLRLRAGLTATGIEHGDRVAVLMGNSQAWIEALFAITLAGGVCVPINVLLRGSAVDQVLASSGAKVLFVDPLAQQALGETKERPESVVVVGDVVTAAGTTRLSYDDLVARGQPTLPERLPQITDPAMIYYTSGTTGQPKGACHAHSGILWNTYHQIADVELTRDDVYLLVPSFSWAAGFHDVTLPLWWLGGRVVVLPSGGMTIDKIVTGVEDVNATSVLMVPTLLKQLIMSPEHLERLRKTRLRRIYTGGEPVPQAVIENVHAELPNTRIVQIYGFSEFPLVTTILGASETKALAHKTGRASSIVTLAVRTADGTITDRGEGEVLVRSPATMMGYYNRPDANEEAFRDGWFNTGDMGRIDDDGYMTLTGRVKDMIICGGMNIYPRELEEVIYTLEGVREAAVVGIPDAQWGERVVAIVVGSVTEEAVSRLCTERLSSYMRPKTIFVRDEPLPRTPTGKVLKRELRPWAEAETKK